LVEYVLLSGAAVVPGAAAVLLFFKYH